MFQAAGAALIRATSYPHDLTLPPWPDPTADQPEQWLGWLRQAWTLPEFTTAVTHAAPALAIQITRALAGEPLAVRRLRRLVEAAMRYLLRWTTRATPFGRFAGIAAVQLGPHAAVRWGEAHHEVTRPDGRIIAEHAGRAERDLATLRSVTVVTNSLGYPRGGVWVLPCARAEGDRIWDVEIDLTDAVRLAVETATSPIAFSQLAERVAERLSARAAAVERLLSGLVAAGVLLSEIRPPVTVTDPTAHLARYVDLPDAGDHLAVDLRVDCSVTLPPAVVREACEAASTLVRVAPHLSGWAEYHRAFIERWGPGAAVPLRDVLRVLGFPAGYRGSSRRNPAQFTARDALLAELAQRSALDGCAEVVLDDELVGRLRGDDDRPPIPHTELRFGLAAATPRDLDRGAFTLTVVSGARHAAVAAARFLHLLTPAELADFRHVYANLPTAMPGADTVQLSGPPLDARLATVARTPELLPVLPVGDFHPNPLWTLADLTVAGDGRRLWLLSLTTGRPVEPLLVNSVLLPTVQQPLIRFLTEIWTAWTAPCIPFDWGHARSLPFLPRVRRGRSILHPARWMINAAVLSAATATWPRWKAAWQRQREQLRLPREVLLGDDDVRLRLDLDEPAHVALLRGHLDRHRQAVLTEAPGPAGWIDGRPAELLLTLTRTPPHQPTPDRPARPASAVQHRPGQSHWLDARLTGRTEHILTYLADGPDDLPEGWWFLRYPDPRPHLRLRIPLRAADRFAETAHQLAAWAQRLDEDGLLADYALATYRPETRHGAGPTLTAAEAVFAADSRAVLGRLTGDRQAATAAGMITIAHAFTGDGAAWLADRAPHRSGPRLDPRQLASARNPYRDSDLAAALTTYRTFVDRDGLDADEVLADLLHLHHARMIGVDPASERHCLAPGPRRRPHRPHPRDTMTAGQSLAEGATGIALLHLETGSWPAAYAALEQATAEGVSVAEGASLYYGVPALAFVLAASHRPSLARAQAVAAEGTAAVTRHRLEAAHRRIDQREQPQYAEFDLIRGLTGLGVTLRRIGNHDLLREVLTYLVRLTEPIGGLPGWWCPHGPNRAQPGPIGGHSNHGIAHGISGPLALLALTLNDGITIDGHAEAITRICQWLDTWQQQTSSGHWWPQTVTLDDLRRNRPSQQGPRRPSWCYGTPGIARAQQLAGRALDDTARQHLAENAFIACANDPAQIGQLTDRSLCHGTAGLITTARRIAADALTPTPLTPLQRLHQHATAAADEPAGMLDGACGAALAAAGTTTTSWDACLLLC